MKLGDLPPDGLAEVARFIDFLQFKTGIAPGMPRARTGKHPAFGIWADRTEIQDPVQFTEHLRRMVETRQDGESVTHRVTPGANRKDHARRASETDVRQETPG